MYNLKKKTVYSKLIIIKYISGTETKYRCFSEIRAIIVNIEFLGSEITSLIIFNLVSSFE